MNPLVVVLGVILVVIILMSLYSSFFSGTSTMVTTGHLELGYKGIDAADISATTTRTYSIWVYMNQWNGKKNNKMIFGREKDIVLFLDKDSAKLKCLINPVLADITAAGSSSALTTIENIVDITNDFPIQKWAFITVVIDSGTNIVDYYLDGKLVKSVKATSTDVTADAESYPITFGIGHNTYISQFKRTEKAIGPQDVWNLYAKGNPGSSVVGNYNVNLSILKDNAISSSLSLF